MPVNNSDGPLSLRQEAMPPCHAGIAENSTTVQVSDTTMLICSTLLSTYYNLYYQHHLFKTEFTLA